MNIALRYSFYNAIAEVENGVRSGWNSDKKRWFPHESLEGGTPTIAYGHKLSTNEVNEGTLKNNGLSELEAWELLVKELEDSMEKASSQWNQHFPNANLSERDLYLLTDIVYNTGSLVKGGVWRWPNLARAIVDGDEQRMFQESLRWYRTPSGVKKPLTKRSIRVCVALGMEFNHEVFS